MSRTTERERTRRRLRTVIVLAAVAGCVFLFWPRGDAPCQTYGRAADYQSTPATIGTGVTCQR